MDKVLERVQLKDVERSHRVPPAAVELQLEPARREMMISTSRLHLGDEEAASLAHVRSSSTMLLGKDWKSTLRFCARFSLLQLSNSMGEARDHVWKSSSDMSMA